MGQSVESQRPVRPLDDSQEEKSSEKNSSEKLSQHAHESARAGTVSKTDQRANDTSHSVLPSLQIDGLEARSKAPAAKKPESKAPEKAKSPEAKSSAKEKDSDKEKPAEKKDEAKGPAQWLVGGVANVVGAVWSGVKDTAKACDRVYVTWTDKAMDSAQEHLLKQGADANLVRIGREVIQGQRDQGRFICGATVGFADCTGEGIAGISEIGAEIVDERAKGNPFAELSVLYKRIAEPVGELAANGIAHYQKAGWDKLPGDALNIAGKYCQDFAKADAYDKGIKTGHDLIPAAMAVEGAWVIGGKVIGGVSKLAKVSKVAQAATCAEAAAGAGEAVGAAGTVARTAELCESGGSAAAASKTAARVSEVSEAGESAVTTAKTTAKKLESAEAGKSTGTAAKATEQTNSHATAKSRATDAPESAGAKSSKPGELKGSSESADANNAPKNSKSEKNSESGRKAELDCLDKAKKDLEKCKKDLAEANKSLGEKLNSSLEHPEVSDALSELESLRKKLAELPENPELAKLKESLQEFERPYPRELLKSMERASNDGHVNSNLISRKVNEIDTICASAEGRLAGTEIIEFIDQSFPSGSLGKEFKFVSKLEKDCLSKEAKLKSLEVGIESKFGGAEAAIEAINDMQAIIAKNENVLEQLAKLIDPSGGVEQVYNTIWKFMNELPDGLKLDFEFLKGPLEEGWRVRTPKPSALSEFGQRGNELMREKFFESVSVPKELAQLGVGKGKNFFADAYEWLNGKVLARRFDISNKDGLVKGYLDVLEGGKAKFPGIHYLAELPGLAEAVQDGMILAKEAVCKAFDIKFKERLNPKLGLEHVPISDDSLLQVLKAKYARCFDPKGNRIKPEEFRKRVFKFFEKSEELKELETLEDVVDLLKHAGSKNPVAQQLLFDAEKLRAQQFEELLKTVRIARDSMLKEMGFENIEMLEELLNSQKFGKEAKGSIAA